MKKIFLSGTAVLFLVSSVPAQTPGGVSTPEVWSRDTVSVRTAPSPGLTYIGVSKVTRDSEQAVWSIANGGATTRIQTTSRAADLSRGTFMNYAPDSLPELRLYSYTTSARVGGGQQLRIGQQPDRRLPVSDGGTGIVEYVVYPRSLSAQERSRVESYMALKYGICLRGSYLDSRGTVIWNAYTNKAYCHRIAGIIADGGSALYLSRARSSEDGRLLTVSAGTPLTDGQSLLWGDDGGSPSFGRSKSCGKWLGRKWKASATGMDGTPVDIAVAPGRLRQIQPLSDGESYYLAVDPTGTGTFPVKTLQYHKASAVDGDSVVFRNIRLGGGDVFTLRAARDMFTTIDVQQPGQDTGATGTLDVRVTGGIPPYRMRLVREKTPVHDRTHGDSLQTIGSLVEGRYLLTTTDRVGSVSEHEFLVSTNGIAEVTDDSADGGNGFSVSASPNPTSDGYVRVQVETAASAPLDMTLYTGGGARVSSRSLPSDSYFDVRIYLPSSGVYLLTLRSGTHEKTIKLVRA